MLSLGQYTEKEKQTVTTKHKKNYTHTQNQTNKTLLNNSSSIIAKRSVSTEEILLQ